MDSPLCHRLLMSHLQTSTDSILSTFSWAVGEPGPNALGNIGLFSWTTGGTTFISPGLQLADTKMGLNAHRFSVGRTSVIQVLL